MLLGRALGNLARVLQVEGKLDEAQATYERVRDITRAAMGPEHVLVADPLEDLGRLALRRGRLSEAGALFERALAMREKGQGPTHPDVGMTLLSLAALECAEGRFPRAEALLARAGPLLEKGGPEKLAELEFSRGNLALASGHPALADPHFLASFQARLKSVGERSPKLREPLVARATAALVSGREADALALLEEAQAQPGRDDALLKATRGHALWSRDRAAGLALVAEAREEWTRTGDALRLRELDVWKPARVK